MGLELKHDCHLPTVYWRTVKKEGSEAASGFILANWLLLDSFSHRYYQETSYVSSTYLLSLTRSFRLRGQVKEDNLLMLEGLCGKHGYKTVLSKDLSKDFASLLKGILSKFRISTDDELFYLSNIMSWLEVSHSIIY